MIISGRQIEVYAFGEPVDMRKNFDSLSALVEVAMPRNVLSGCLFLFVSKNRKRAKVLYFDGTGLCLLSKRLEKGRFAPVYDRARSRAVKLTLSELTLFMEGSESIGSSPPLLTLADLTPRWPEKNAEANAKV